MDKLIDFYKRVLESVGFSYNDNGNILRVSNDGKETVVMADGKPLVLPTKYHIDNLVELDENNEPCIKKILFNPLNEDMIKGDSHSLVKLKDFVSVILNHSLFTSALLLLHVGKEKHLQDEATMLVTEYLSSLSEIDRGANVKRLIDDDTISNWEKIYNKMIEGGFKRNSIINIFIKKRGRDSKGEMSNRLTTINSTLLNDLEELRSEKSPVYLDIKLRTKDVKVFITTMNFLLDNLDIKTNTFSIGSSNNLAPAFVSLFTMYLKTIEKPNQILKDLRYVNYDYSDSGYKEIKVTMDEILNVENYKSILHSIPNDIEAHRMVNSYTNQQQAQAPTYQVQENVNTVPNNNQPSTGSGVSDYINRKRQSMGYYQPPAVGIPQQGPGYYQQPQPMYQPQPQPVYQQAPGYYQQPYYQQQQYVGIPQQGPGYYQQPQPMYQPQPSYTDRMVPPLSVGDMYK